MDWFDDAEEHFLNSWLQFCNHVATMGDGGKFVSDKFLKRLVIGSPVLLGFVFACIVVFILQQIIPSLERMLGVHDTFQITRFPLQYTSLFTHIFAHSDFNHLKGNLTHLLLVGPSVEHAFGSENLIKIISIVAVTSAFAHIFVGRHLSHQLGASGVVFAFIILNSLVSARYGKIPVSFVIVTILYLGDELIDFIFSRDAMSHHAHLVGGIVGGMAGFYIIQQKNQTKLQQYINKLKSFKKST